MNAPRGPTVRTTVVVFDDRADVAEAVRAAADAELLAHRDSLTDLVAVLSETMPDLVVLAAGLAGDHVAAHCREIADAFPVCRVLLVADDREIPFEAALAGAIAVAARSELVETADVIVPQVARAEARLTPVWAGEALRAFEADDAPRLSATEREVLQRMARGAVSEAIAGIHEVPPRLVRLHAGYALTKLQRAERAQQT